MLVSRAVQQNAIDRARVQGWLADSPGFLTESGKILLCAASCLAYAALQEYKSQEAAEEFARRIAKENDKADVKGFFRTFGWDEALCNFVMIVNDKKDAGVRLSWFRSFVHELR